MRAAKDGVAALTPVHLQAGWWWVAGRSDGRAAGRERKVRRVLIKCSVWIEACVQPSNTLANVPNCDTSEGKREGGERKSWLEPLSEGECTAASKRKYASVVEWRRATSFLIAGLTSFRTCNSCWPGDAGERIRSRSLGRRTLDHQACTRRCWARTSLDLEALAEVT